MRKPIIGVMGPGDRATSEELRVAYQLGQAIARAGWVLLTGGRNQGVMDAASRGAKSAGGLTVGILPGHDRQGISAAIDIPILTDMGSARNNINVLSSDVVIACGMGAGTASEVALALKANKSVILLHSSGESQAFFQTLAGKQVLVAAEVEAAIALVNQLL
ncbi:TIGR00725 family protein [Kovacikia minuta CCNUW1]|uniref:TIGR00725 family protein n=1 Tax=Kovacikia minuta TaxID=2931930 RepID=UPI001CCEBCED|nr:TIGR00725 family protein [Kovacikia minuta]UBF27921.1 TIGR00725 family protein [Kovacikia minuta CCNUW1]